MCCRCCNDDAHMRAHLFTGTDNSALSRCEQDVDTDTDLQRYSPKDRIWDTQRAFADDVQSIYASQIDNKRFNKLAARISECCLQLDFNWQDEGDGTSSLKLHKALFCRVRNCPVCQWRRSLMWQAKFYSALPSLADRYPSARFAFLTLTVRNCDVTDLRATIKQMNDAWKRLSQRKKFKRVLGWVRTTEVTRNAKDNSAHPHFHVLLMLPPSMLSGRNYIKQAQWAELWQSCLRVDYAPNVDIRIVRPNKKYPSASQAELLGGAVKEVLKYSVKPADMISNADWFLTYTEQVHNLRFLATSGAFKDIFKQCKDEDEQEDLIHLTDESSDAEAVQQETITFDWKSQKKKYKKRKPS